MRSKSGGHELLPLELQTGEAMARYLCHGRLNALSVLAVVVWLLYVPALAVDQKSAQHKTVSGLVTYTAENGIPDVAVTLKDLQTGETIVVYTEADGRYQFSNLNPHHDYQFQASFKWLASETRQVSSLDTRGELSINLAISSRQDKEQAVADKLATLMNWVPGSVVAEIGAGEGQLTLAAAERVGPAGHVFTTELDPRLLVDLQDLAVRLKAKNITVIKAGEAETNLPRECCDSIFMRHVYHHFTQPAQEDTSLFQSLKPGGILAVIDFPPSKEATTLESSNEGAPNNRSGHGITRQALIDELNAAGFQVVMTPTEWPGKDYCVVFRKPSK